MLHALFAFHQPFTNDEGAYLYDARTVLEGNLPAGDVVAKAPVPIVLFSLGELITGKSVFAARLVTSIVSILTAIPLFFLLQSISSAKTAYTGAILWLFGSGTIVFYTMGHTEAIASFFSILSLCLFVVGIQRTTIYARYIFLAGFCFALAYASRKTSIALVVPLLLSGILFRYSVRELGKAIGIFLIGVLLFVIPWGVCIYLLYGLSGVWHMIGGGYGDILLNAQSVSPWAGSAGHMFLEASRIGAPYGLLLLIVCIASMRERVLIGASWVATLGVLYWLWPTHLVEYVGDFVPGVVLAGSVAISSLFLKRWQQYVVISVFLLLSIFSLHSVYRKPWTGMFTREAITESAAWMKQNISLQEEVFTAAAIVPYASGHHIPFNLSHPQWYRYDFISPQDKSLFLPGYDQVIREAHVRTSWAIDEQLTQYAYPGLITSIFKEVHAVSNNTQYRQNPLQFLKRQ